MGLHSWSENNLWIKRWWSWTEDWVRKAYWNDKRRAPPIAFAFNWFTLSLRRLDSGKIYINDHNSWRKRVFWLSRSTASPILLLPVVESTPLCGLHRNWRLKPKGKNETLCRQWKFSSFVCSKHSSWCHRTWP